MKRKFGTPDSSESFLSRKPHKAKKIQVWLRSFLGFKFCFNFSLNSLYKRRGRVTIWVVKALVFLGARRSRREIYIYIYINFCLLIDQREYSENPKRSSLISNKPKIFSERRKNPLFLAPKTCKS